MQTGAIPNVNCLWGEIAAGTLARLGVRHAVIAPGSRSAPLVWGLARCPGIETISVLDERSAGFYALGLAKASGRPVALVCTSGTAAANFFPAVIEASLSAAPLLVLTADRPPELRDCHAGQAIDQVKLYGHYPRWQHEVALPENTPVLLRYLRQTLAQACERAQSPWPGPVHLNFPFREPLAPTPEPGFVAPEKTALDRLFAGLGQANISAAAPISSAKFPQSIWQARRGVIVAGPARPADSANYVKQVAAWAKRRGWPVLVDALSPLRHTGKIAAQRVSHYDLILRARQHWAGLAPEVVIHLGPLPTSRILREWLSQLNAPVLVVHEGPENTDPLHRGATYWRGPASQMASVDAQPPPADPRYLARWRKLEKFAGAACAENLDALDWLFEGKAAWQLSRLLPAGTPIFAASSMPVRDCEYFWEPGRGAEFYFNRGANGIDGTLSTALGVAHARGRPTVLYAGDLALLHDQNGLLAARELPPGASLTIVLINNDGGGIFEHLPIAKFDPPFERHFATPQGCNFKKLAAAHRLDYLRVKSWKEFARALRSLPSRGVRLIEIRTDRKRDAAFRTQMFQKISRNLDARRA